MKDAENIAEALSMRGMSAITFARKYGMVLIPDDASRQYTTFSYPNVVLAA